jgi:hypothetical protein
VEVVVLVHLHFLAVNACGYLLGTGCIDLPDLSNRTRCEDGPYVTQTDRRDEEASEQGDAFELRALFCDTQSRAHYPDNQVDRVEEEGHGRDVDEANAGEGYGGVHIDRTEQTSAAMAVLAEEAPLRNDLSA